MCTKVVCSMCVKVRLIVRVSCVIGVPHRQCVDVVCDAKRAMCTTGVAHRRCTSTLTTLLLLLPYMYTKLPAPRYLLLCVVFGMPSPPHGCMLHSILFAKTFRQSVILLHHLHLQFIGTLYRRYSYRSRISLVSIRLSVALKNKHWFIRFSKIGLATILLFLSFWFVTIRV